MKNKVCVIIRVYNRVEDLKYCVDIIRDTWKSNDYYVVVVSNGEKDGYIISDDCKNKIDVFVNLTNNVGHFQGNSQLLLEGLKYIPEDCKFTIILEADTWLYGDALIEKYIEKLEKTNAVWASAQFFRYIENLATDIALVNSSFVKEHKKIFTFSGTPEYYVANYLNDNGFKYIYINENMPINMPRYMRKYPFAPTGRFFSFEKSKMVTHHIESLKGGMEEKKFYFNVVAKTKYFNCENNRSHKWIRMQMRIFAAFSYLLPYKSWFIKGKKNLN
jgi:glycosyltransferase involved in cell wall biosynthesis